MSHRTLHDASRASPPTRCGNAVGRGHRRPAGPPRSRGARSAHGYRRCRHTPRSSKPLNRPGSGVLSSTTGPRALLPLMFSSHALPHLLHQHTNEVPVPQVGDLAPLSSGRARSDSRASRHPIRTSVDALFRQASSAVVIGAGASLSAGDNLVPDWEILDGNQRYQATFFRLG